VARRESYVEPAERYRICAVTDLPIGTVTVVFTDIEGSTRLAESLGEEWPAEIRLRGYESAMIDTDALS
jgi:class 3 adenylate cyclase